MAKVTIAFTGWEEGKVEPAVLELPVVDATAGGAGAAGLTSPLAPGP